MRARRIVIAAVAVAIFAAAFLYRFNALGGALGGFDNDHFLYYLRAKQVAHGERPLRDFSDAGLQGAWPALTYEVPALAQRLGGETLLSEAVLCIVLIAVALVLTFLSAAQWAGIPTALAVTLVSLFFGAKLYGYSKLLIFAGACALFFCYARRPDTRRIALLALWSAVAFLFRHDFLVYLVAPVAVLAGVMAWPDWRQLLRQALVYGGLVTVLLAGPLYSVQHFVGIRTYVEESAAMSRREAERTHIPTPSFKATPGGARDFLTDEDNAAAFVYFVAWAIPLLALAGIPFAREVGGLTRRQVRAVVAATAILALALDYSFLRGNLSARFGDLGAPVAVLAAWVFTARSRSGGGRVATAAAAVVCLASVLISADALGSVTRELDTTGLSDSVGKVERRFIAAAGELRALPASVPLDEQGRRDVVAYLRECTRPDDRVLVLASTPEIATFANRAFAAGEPTFTPGFYTSEADQRRMLQRLARQSVPVVVTEAEGVYQEDLAPEFPLVDEYVRTFYEPVGELPGLRERPMRVLVRRQRVGHPWDATGWPCFS